MCCLVYIAPWQTGDCQEMNQLAADTYLYDIPSIHQRHPDMPALLGNLNLDTSIRAGDPLDYLQVERAKVLALSLRGLRGEFTLLRLMAQTW